jgi:DNA-binding transcriptional MerR regulator
MSMRAERVADSGDAGEIVRAVKNTHAGIGEVLSQLRADFPDTTISKLRFLESEGLVDPERTSAGYRKYSVEDVARLRYVLTAQRDHYLPLKVIREQLDEIDSGVLPSTQTAPAPPTAAVGGAPRRLLRALEPATESAPVDSRLEEAETSAPDGRVTRAQLRVLAETDEDLLGSLEQFGLVIADARGQFAEHDVAIVQAASGLAGYGIEPRHLRAFRGAADREAGLFKQVVTPLARQRNRGNVDGDDRDPAREVAAELCSLSVMLHAALTRAALERAL